MFSLILSSLLGATASCSGAECANGVSLTITIKAEVVASHSLSIEEQALEIDGAYALTVHVLTTGEGYFDIKEKYVVLDGNYLNIKEPLIIYAENQRIVINTKSQEYFVMKWPENQELPKRKELLALRNAIFNTPSIDIAIARVNKYYKRNRI